ncbi:hypothetical protein V6N13_065696 [Hibiscus sabdariffa]|uniref:DAGKc domain-containing protein n=1 Tax=Hibiscus sabdariffa TaxID=183260 RepID=A0ABR2QQD7_9ROSI
MVLKTTAAAAAAAAVISTRGCACSSGGYVFVAGGDGTVGWVLGCLGELHTKGCLPLPPVLIIPLEPILIPTYAPQDDFSCSSSLPVFVAMSKFDTLTDKSAGTWGQLDMFP